MPTNPYRTGSADWHRFEAERLGVEDARRAPSPLRRASSSIIVKSPIADGRYSLTVDVEVRNGSLRLPSAQTFSQGLSVEATQALFAQGTAKKKAPEWKPGDVVVVTYGPGRTATHVQNGYNSWPGSEVLALRTDEIDRLFSEGRVNPVLQAGGVPFDASRLS